MEKNKFREKPKFDNIKDILYNSVKLYPDHTAFTIKEKIGKQVSYNNITYSGLLNDINCLGAALHNIGLGAKRIAIIGKNRYEWAISHLSCMLGGMVSVPLDKDLHIEELEESLIRSKADAIIFDEKHKEVILQIKEKGKTALKEFFCMGKAEGFTGVSELVERGDELLKQGERSFIDTKLDPNAMSILLFTSGTTSKSKAVMLSQNAIAINVYDMLIVETFLDTDVNIAFLPYHHIFGSTAIIVMLSAGVKTVFPDGLKYIKQNLVEYKVSVFVGVPLLVDKIYSTIQKEIEKQGKTKLMERALKISNFLMKFNIDLRKKFFSKVWEQLGGELRMVVAGGAPLSKETARGFNEMGVHLVQGYGLTETAPVIAAENDRYVRYGSVGIPMRHTEAQISGPDENGIGELKVRGPNVMLGYYENEEATNEVIKDGWFYTGDLAYFDKDGYLFITGRKKDMIVMKNGKKVFPEELEALILRHDEIEDAFVFGVPSRKDDVRLAVKVLLNDVEMKERYGEISDEEIYKIIWDKIELINETLPPYKNIKRLNITKEPFIKTTTMKVKRQEELSRTLNQLKAKS
ncbi:MAG: AMP-binding protein [Eubacteriales bacterium]|nr:AMP-binding protein [Eubacteriales bacterium]